MSETMTSVRNRVLSGLSANAISQVQNIVAQLSAVPVFLACWGADQYGQWLLMSAIPTYIALADLGVGTAVSNQLLVDAEREQHAQGDELFSAVLAFLLLVTGLVMVGALGLVVAAGINDQGDGPLHWVSANAFAVLCLALYAPLSMLAVMLSASLRAAKRYATGMNLNTGIRTAELIATVLAVSMSKSFAALSLALLATRFLGVIVLAWVMKSFLPWLSFRPAFKSISRHRSILVSGMAFTGFSLSHALFSQGVLLAIGWRLGTAEVSAFSVMRTVTRMVYQALNIVILAAQPEITMAYAAGNWDLLRFISRQTLRVSFWLGFTTCVLVAIGGPYFLGLWTHGRVAVDDATFWVLCATQFVTTLWLSSAIALTGTNRHLGLSLIYLAAGIVAVAATALSAAQGGLYLVAWVLMFTEIGLAALAVWRYMAFTGDTVTAYFRSPFFKPVLASVTIKTAA
jgi:O-antigen/teichoic acid export membrane protein